MARLFFILLFHWVQACRMFRFLPLRVMVCYQLRLITICFNNKMSIPFSNPTQEGIVVVDMVTVGCNVNCVVNLAIWYIGATTYVMLIQHVLLIPPMSRPLLHLISLLLTRMMVILKILLMPLNLFLFSTCVIPNTYIFSSSLSASAWCVSTSYLPLYVPCSSSYGIFSCTINVPS